MMKKTMALALCSLLAFGALLPAAQAAHMTFYGAPFNMHREMASFEPRTTDAQNKNGPAPDDTRQIPNDANIHPDFIGLADILEKTAASDPGPSGKLKPADPLSYASGDAIMDHFLFGSAVEAGALVPYSYFVGQAGGIPRTTPTSMHFVWFGWFDDKDAVGTPGRGVISDVWCAQTHLNCGGTDEFTWRGSNVVNGTEADKTWNGLAWFFPGDYDGSLGTGNRQGGPVSPATGLNGEQLSALSGDCELYNQGGNNPGCVNPSPDMPYADSTQSAPNANNQRWAGNNGGGQWTPEEFLLVSQHIVSVMVNASLLDPGSATKADVDCTASQDCFRDYDWYQALAGDTVGGLYLNAFRTDYLPPPDIPTVDDEPAVGIRSVWSWGERTFALQVSPCPVSTVPFLCSPDTRHLDAQASGSSNNKAFASQAFSNVVPAYTGTPALKHPVGNTPPQGFYGDYTAVTGVFTPESRAVFGGFVRPSLTSWVWDDANNDNVIGQADPYQAILYGWGAASSPNNGACDVSGGGFCELTLTTVGYATKVVKVTPKTTWAPGTQWFRHYENGYWGTPCPVVETATSNTVECFEEPFWHMGALSGNSAVFLRADPERCAATYGTCRTIDALLIPDGTPGLDGVVLASAADTDPDGAVTVSWREGTTQYSVTFNAAFEADVLDSSDVNAADYPAGATAIALAIKAWAEAQV